MQRDIYRFFLLHFFSGHPLWVCHPKDSLTRGCQDYTHYVIYGTKISVWIRCCQGKIRRPNLVLLIRPVYRSLYLYPLPDHEAAFTRGHFLSSFYFAVLGKFRQKDLIIYCNPTVGFNP